METNIQVIRACFYTMVLAGLFLLPAAASGQSPVLDKNGNNTGLINLNPDPDVVAPVPGRANR